MGKNFVFNFRIFNLTSRCHQGGGRKPHTLSFTHVIHEFSLRVFPTHMNPHF